MVSTATFHARVRGSVPGLGGLKETKNASSDPRVKVSIVGSLRDREVANFESCVWRAVSSQSSHHPQEVLLAQFSLYVHKGGLKPDSFHLILWFFTSCHTKQNQCKLLETAIYCKSKSYRKTSPRACKPLWCLKQYKHIDANNTVSACVSSDQILYFDSTDPYSQIHNKFINQGE